MLKATGPTKAPGLLPNPEERKGLNEAQHVAHSHPSQAHRTISASLEGSPRDPRPRKRISASLKDNGPALERWPISASLEDGGPALERVANLRLARGRLSAQGTNGPAAQPTAVRRHLRPATPPRLKGRAASDCHSRSGCDRRPVH